MVSEIQCSIVRYCAEGMNRVGRRESINALLAYIRDDCAKKLRNPMTISIDCNRWNSSCMSESTRHANKGTYDDPVRPTYFNGYPSISVAK